MNYHHAPQVRPEIPKDTPLPVDFVPGSFTVICGRGKDTFNHEGNRRYRLMVEETKPKYLKCNSRTEKSIVVVDLVDAFRDGYYAERQSWVGAFVKKVGNQWYDIGDTLAKEKVSHSMREDRYSRRRCRKNKQMIEAQKQQQEQKYSPMSTNSNEVNMAAMAMLPPFPDALSSLRFDDKTNLYLEQRQQNLMQVLMGQQARSVALVSPDLCPALEPTPIRERLDEEPLDISSSEEDDEDSTSSSDIMMNLPATPPNEQGDCCGDVDLFEHIDMSQFTFAS